MSDLQWLTPFITNLNEMETNQEQGNRAMLARKASIVSSVTGTATNVVYNHMDIFAKRTVPYYCSLIFPPSIQVTSLIESIDCKILDCSDTGGGGGGGSDGEMESNSSSSRKKRTRRRRRVSLTLPHFFAVSRVHNYMKLCTLLRPCTFRCQDFEQWTRYTTKQEYDALSRRIDLKALLLCPVCGTLAKQGHRYWLIAYPLMVKQKDAQSMLLRYKTQKHQSRPRPSRRTRREDDTSCMSAESILTHSASHLMARLVCLSCLDNLHLSPEHQQNLHEATPADENSDHHVVVAPVLRRLMGADSDNATEITHLSSNVSALSLSSSVCDEASCSSSSSCSCCSGNHHHQQQQHHHDDCGEEEDAEVDGVFGVLDFYVESGVWKVLEKEHVKVAVQLHGSGGSGSGGGTNKDEALKRMGRNTTLVCQNCKKQPATLICGACKRPVYCSKPCQKADWKRHRTMECTGSSNTKKKRKGGLVPRTA